MCTCGHSLERHFLVVSVRFRWICLLSSFIISESGMFWIAIVAVVVLLHTSSGIRPIENICHHQPGRRIYVDFGEAGDLKAANVSGSVTGYFAPNPGRAGPGPPLRTNGSSHQQCSVELVTCPSCVIRVVFYHLNLSHTCGGGNILIDSPCRCDYVWLAEPPYDALPGQQFCGVVQKNSTEESALTYQSKTRTLSIVLLYSENHGHAFSLSFMAKRNEEFINGNPLSSGSLTSPFFPTMYPRDLISEHTLNCTQPNCRVRLIFTDFQIGVLSFIEFFDGRSRRLEITTGLSFRPPVIITSGSTLLLRFFANGGSGVGFKAIYSFVTDIYAETAIKPNTDCGGFVEDFGGAITMMSMVMTGVRSYDCIWLIRPPENFLHIKTHLSLKIATFLNFAGNTELQVRQGLTSDQLLLETLRHPMSQLQLYRPKEHIVPVSTGFYVRLKGSFDSASRLVITYAAFSYNKCFPGSEFQCANQRCIPGKLSCDSFDHCGDNSDELASCFQEWDPVFGDRHWYSQTPNYFFPKTDRYADLKTATVVFLVSSLGLIALISALIILLYRINSRARQQRELQSHLQTISELLDNARIEDLSSDEPPVYEPPPEYEDVMKAPPSTSRRARRISQQGPRRSRSSPGERRGLRSGTPPILEVALTPERLQRASHLQDYSRRPSHSSAASMAGASSVPDTTPLPDSPPPPYSPTSSQIFMYGDSPIPVKVFRKPDNPGVVEGSVSWCVTAVTNNNIVVSNTTKETQQVTLSLAPRRHRRSQSCGDMTSSPNPPSRLTQSNPLTPFDSPVLERVFTPTCSSPTTESDICLFSSLGSADINYELFENLSHDFDWEAFDKQFPERKEQESLSNGPKIEQLLKKFDDLVFGGSGARCACEGACNCVTKVNH